MNDDGWERGKGGRGLAASPPPCIDDVHLRPSLQGRGSYRPNTDLGGIHHQDCCLTGLRVAELVHVAVVRVGVKWPKSLQRERPSPSTRTRLTEVFPLSCQRSTSFPTVDMGRSEKTCVGHLSCHWWYVSECPSSCISVESPKSPPTSSRKRCSIFPTRAVSPHPSRNAMKGTKSTAMAGNFGKSRFMKPGVFTRACR